MSAQRGYDPDDPVQRSQLAYGLDEATARTVLHCLAWAQPEAFAAAVAEAMAYETRLSRYLSGGVEGSRLPDAPGHRHVPGEVASSICPKCVAMAGAIRAGADGGPPNG